MVFFHPVLPRLAVASILCSVALLIPIAEAHLVVLEPPPTWTTNDKATRFNPVAFLENEGFVPVEDFNKWLSEQKQYTSFRDFMDNAKYSVAPGASFNCGFTDPNGEARPVPVNGMLRTSGYTHNGPCAAFFNDTLAFESKDCHKQFPGKSNPVDFSLCKGYNVLHWYWLAVRYVKQKYSWQVYKECVPMMCPTAIKK